MSTLNPASYPAVKAALIDMDGVLYDSMKYHALAWQRMMAEIGIRTDVNEFFLYEGMTGEATIDLIFRREFGRGVSKEEARRLYARKAELFVEMGRKEMMPGAKEMTEALHRAGVKCVLVTGSAQSSLISRLDEDYPGIFPKGQRVTALDVTKGKPDPEPYLKGLEIAGTRPEETIIIENAPLGVRAGVAAARAVAPEGEPSIRTFAVTTGPIPREAFEAEGPTAIFSSMPEFAAALMSLSEIPIDIQSGDYLFL